ncbi:MAG: aminodeoxychorismate synthase component I [Terracidiphilus sp.]
MPWHPLPAEVCALVEHTPATVLLECSNTRAAEPVSRLFVSPLRVLVASVAGDLSDLFAQIESATAEGLFAAGFFTYECGQAFEPKAKIQTCQLGRPGGRAPSQEQESRIPGQPLAWFGIYAQCHLFNHAAGVFVDGDPPELGRAYPCPADAGETSNDTSEPDHPFLNFGLTGLEYVARIEAIREWIRAGDVYQLNFTFPLRNRMAGSPAALYNRLRTRQPVEYGAYLHWQSGYHILSFSPELFFDLEQHHATRCMTTRPMKGTAPRGRTTVEDRTIAEWLRNDAKNRSENVMIVDLLRNDLGRLCAYGSVHVENLFVVQRYPSLWQMTSTVTGELRPGVGYEEIFRALFPCGSITGAPKVRAMQLLAEIEAEPRGIYTGAIGFFSRARTVFNVAIRTLELQSESGELGAKDLKMGVGSGIVIDSNAAEEFRECQVKAEFLTGRDESFSLVETLLWQGGFPLIELHLDRLEDSANYFGFDCDRAIVKSALIASAVAFHDLAARKVRLLNHSDGSLHIEHEILPAETAANALPGLVCIAPQRTDSTDRKLFHKTTPRELYASAFKAACDAGFIDVLFLNQCGQVTEGAISNVFIQKQGRWLTPPVECGLLAGVYRRHLLETVPGIEQRILYPQDLKSADAVYLTNAVRGLRRVVVDWEG